MDIDFLVENNKVVQMSYSIFDRDGRLIEARSQENPIEFLVGHGQILKSLESKIIGLASGFSGKFNFPPVEAHGEYRKDLVVEMSLDQFPTEMNVEKGMKFESEGPEGQPIALHVIDISGDKVLVDGNHPLAGEELNFDITILDVREAATEEIRQGKVLADMEPENTTIH